MAKRNATAVQLVEDAGDAPTADGDIRKLSAAESAVFGRIQAEQRAAFEHLGKVRFDWWLGKALPLAEVAALSAAQSARQRFLDVVHDAARAHGIVDAHMPRWRFDPVKLHFVRLVADSP